MDKPKAPETLEAPKEASGTNQNGSGLASVSDISDDFVVKNVEVETQAVKDDVSEIGDSARFKGEKSCENVAEIEEGCLVSDECVDEREKEASSIGSLSRKEENEAELGFLESQSVRDEDVGVKERVEDSDGCVDESEKVAKLDSMGLLSRERNEAELGFLESQSVGNGDVGVKERVEDSDGCVDEREKVAKLDSMGSLSREENEGELGLLESQSVGNEDIGVKEMSEEKPSESNGIASSEGISLYVDICGSLSKLVKREDGDEEEGRSVDGRESSFVVGDIVWVQTKNQSWWPGKICEPDDAPKIVAKSGEGAYLVWYYGISHFSWCFPFQLKPFHKSFGEMSGKNRNRIFLGAVEKAVDEFGRRVKKEMTCLCDSKGNQNLEGETLADGGVLNSVRISRRLGEFSVTNFEPVAFLERLKYLAEVVSMPRTLDFTVTQNRLWAFYSSIGHRQLPMHLLAEKDDAEGYTLSRPEKVGDQVEDENAVRGNRRKSATKEGFVSSGSRKRKTKKAFELGVEGNGDEAKESIRGKNEMIEKGFDSRERKKSRYLSYPYINLEQKRAAEEDNAKVPKVNPEAGTSQDILSPANPKINGDKFWKKWYKRFSGGIHMPNGSELTNLSLAELLRELLSAAVVGLHPNQISGFTPVGSFFSRFRISAYHDESVDEICPKNMTGQNAGNDVEACLSGYNVPENQPKQKKKKKNEISMKALQDKTSVSSPNVVGSDVPTAGEDSNGTVDQSLGKDLQKAVKKPGQTDSERLKTKPLSGLSDVNISVAGQPLPCNKSKKRKKKKGKGSSLEHLETKQTTDIPDLNGTNAVPSLNDSQVVDHVTSEGKPELLMNPDANAANVSSNVLDACETDAKRGNLVVDLRVPQEGSSGLNYISHTSALLDFVGNDVKPGLIEKDGQPFGVLTAEQGKPMPKKRKRKEKVAPGHVPDLNGASGEPKSVGTETQETNGVTPPVKPKRKKRKKMQIVLNYPRNPSFSARPGTNAGHHWAETNGEALGTALLLTFGPGAALPSSEDLVSTFGKFGQLRESETRVSKDTGSAQIVFVRSADAGEALKSVEKSNPFGSTLLNFRLHQLLAPTGVPEACHAQATPQPPAGPAPPLDFIKQNLQMMTAMLEKSGDSLSQEMRTKLESEIKGLLSKVSSMAGSCS